MLKHLLYTRDGEGGEKKGDVLTLCFVRDSLKYVESLVFLYSNLDEKFIKENKYFIRC